MTAAASAYLPDVRRWRYDRPVPWFVIATLLTVGVAALLHWGLSDIVTLGAESSSGGATPATASGAQWSTAGRAAAIITVEIAAIIGLFAVYRRLPEWLRDALRENIVLTGTMAVVMVLGAIVESKLVIAVWTGLTGLVMLASDVLQHYDVYWLAHNGITILFAGALAAIVSFVGLGPALALAVLLALIDPIAVKLSGYMVSMAAWGLQNRMPVAVVIPAGWRLNIEAWADGDREEDRPDVKVLGNGDLMLPAAVAVAANTAGTIPVAGGLTLLGTAGVVGAATGIALTTGMDYPGDGAYPAMPAVIVGLVPVVAAGWLLEAALGLTGVLA